MTILITAYRYSYVMSDWQTDNSLRQYLEDLVKESCTTDEIRGRMKKDYDQYPSSLLH